MKQPLDRDCVIFAAFFSLISEESYIAAESSSLEDGNDFSCFQSTDGKHLSSANEMVYGSLDEFFRVDVKSSMNELHLITGKAVLNVSMWNLQEKS